jgi:hypothetical protein
MLFVVFQPGMLMKKIHKLSTEGLIDLLSVYTAKYTHLYVARDLQSRAFRYSRNMIKNLQREIKSRRKPGDSHPHVDMSTGDIY